MANRDSSLFPAMLFQTDSSTWNKVLNLFEKTEQSLLQDVEIIKTWLKTQPHLPEIMEDVKIRNFLLLNKFSIENTKQKIDMYYTIRSVLPDLFEKGNPQLPSMKRYIDSNFACLHPKLVDGLHRVFLFKTKTLGGFLPELMGLHCNNIGEVRLYEDCMVGDIHIFDMSDISINDLTRATPTLVAKLFSIYQVYSMRIKEIHFINSPAYVANLMFILKSILKPKIFSRIQVHQDAEIFKKIFNEDEIPEEYGGKGPSLEALNEMTMSYITKYQKRFDVLQSMKVDESKRPEKLDNHDVLGFHGNFKKLDVD